MTDRRILWCACGSDALVLDWLDHDLCLSIWRPAHASLDWRSRLRCLWRVLCHGEPYGDQVILSRESQAALARYVSCGPTLHQELAR